MGGAQGDAGIDEKELPGKAGDRNPAGAKEISERNSDFNLPSILGQRPLPKSSVDDVRQEQQTLKKAGFTDNVVVFYPPEKRDAADATQDVESKRSEAIQSALLNYLVGQTTVTQKPGQALETAQKLAKEQHRKLLADVKVEKENHDFGPASKAAFAYLQELMKDRSLKQTRDLSVSADDVLTDAGFFTFARQQAGYEETKRRSESYQDHLINWMDIVVSSNAKPGDNPKQLQQQAKEERNKIEREKALGVWGEASQEAFAAYQDFFFEKQLPQDIRRLDSWLEQLKTRQPNSLEMNASGRPEDPVLANILVARGLKVIRNSIAPQDALEDASFRQFTRNNDYMKSVSEACSAARLEVENKAFADFITKNNLPKEWLKGRSEDPLKWQQSVKEYIELAMTTTRLIQAAYDLSKTGTEFSGKFPFVPPPGVEFARNARGEIVTRSDGSIEKIHINACLPKDLRSAEQQAGNGKKIRDLVQWQETYGKQIIEAITDYRAVKDNLGKVLAFSDWEIQGQMARLDKNKHFCGLAVADDKYAQQQKEANGEEWVKCNLLSARCYVKTATEGENKGKQVVVQNFDAYQVPIGSYQNWLAFKVASLNPKEEETLLVPDKYYMVQSGDTITPVRGSSLAETLSLQEIQLRAGQTIVPIIDAALLASGVGEVVAAWRTAAAAKGALALTGFQLTKAMATSHLKLAAGLASGLRGAGAQDNETCREILKYQGLYFITDIGTGLATGALSKLRTPPTILDVTTSSYKIGQAMEKAPWIYRATHKGLEQGAGAVFKCLEPYFGVQVGFELAHQAADGLGIDSKGRDYMQDASLVLGDGRKLYDAGLHSFDLSNPKIVQTERENIDRYRQAILANCDEKTRITVSKILDRTKELLSKTPPQGASPAEIKAFQNERNARITEFKIELTDKFLPREAELVKIIGIAVPANRDDQPSEFINGELQKLSDPSKRNTSLWSESARNLTKELDKQTGPGERLAAAIALLTLSRREDSSLPSELATETFDHVRHKLDENNYPSSDTTTTTYARSVSSEAVLSHLEHDLNIGEADLRHIMTGELLLRLGRISGEQYAGVLQDVLNNPNSTAEAKMSALSDARAPRLATILDGIKIKVVLSDADAKRATDAEMREIERLKSSANSLEATLRTVAAKEGGDPDVRAMAAAILYGVNIADRGAGKRNFLERNNDYWQQRKSTPGTYASKTIEFLKQTSSGELERADWEHLAKAADSKENPATQSKWAQLARWERLKAAVQLSEIADLDKKNPETRKMVAQNIASLLSPDDMGLSLNVIKAMIAGEINHLSEKDADDFRQNALKLLRVPKVENDALRMTPEVKLQGTAMAALVLQFNELFKDASVELSNKLCSRMEQLITRGQNRPEEAAMFPGLQIVAIETLANYGSQESLGVLRSRLADIDPDIRAASVQALARLRDSKLAELIPALIDKEKDAAVSQFLRDIAARLPSPGSENYNVSAVKEIERNRIESNMFRPVGDSEALKYLGLEQYNLLYAPNYGRALEIARNESAFWLIHKAVASAGSEPIAVQKQLKEVASSREAQWEKLVATAKGDDSYAQLNEEAGKAKAALFKIMMSGGTWCSTGGLANDAGCEFWETRAASALVDCLQNGKDQHMSVYLVEEGLESEALSGDTKRILLRGLLDRLEHHKLSGQADVASSSFGYTGYPRARLCYVLENTLRAEKNRSGSKSNGIVDEALEAYLRYGDAIKARDIIKPWIDHASTPEVAQARRQKLAQALDGIDVMWNNTPVDKNYKKGLSVLRLEKALNEWSKHKSTWEEQRAAVNWDPSQGEWDKAGSMARNAVAQCIVSGFKGKRLSHDADTDALKLLNTCMESPDRKISAAAAMIIAEAALPENDPAKVEALKIRQRKPFGNTQDIAIQVTNKETTLPSKSEALEYLKRPEYNLLNSASYQSYVEYMDRTNSWSTMGRLFDFRGSEKMDRWEGVSAAGEIRTRQWHKLCAKAQEGTSDTVAHNGSDKAEIDFPITSGDKSYYKPLFIPVIKEPDNASTLAKRAILEIVLDEGTTISRPSGDKIVPYYKGSMPIEDNGRLWAGRAVEALSNCLEHGRDQDKTILLMEEGLRSKQMSAEGKLHWLDKLYQRYEQSNSGGVSTDGNSAKDFVPYPKERMAAILKDVIHAEQSRRGARDERLIGEVLSRYSTVAEPEKYRPIFMAAIEDVRTHRPEIAVARSEQLKKALDGIGTIWDAAKINTVLEPAARTEALKQALENWQLYSNDWDKRRHVANFDSSKGEWDPAASAARDELVRTIAENYKGVDLADACDAEGLKLLAECANNLDGKGFDGKIQLTVARAALGSSLPIAEEVMSKSLLVVAELAAQCQNTEYRAEAAAQLQQFKLKEPLETYVSMLVAIDPLALTKQHLACDSLTALMNQHPDHNLAAKAEEILEQFRQAAVSEVVSGKREMQGRDIDADDPILPKFLQLFEDKNLPEQQRLNAAAPWFMAPHGEVDEATFRRAVSELRALADSGQDVKTQNEAKFLLGLSLKVEVKDNGKEGNWSASIKRQQALIEALGQVRLDPFGVDHSGRVCLEELERIAGMHPWLPIKSEAARVACNHMLSDVVSGLTGDFVHGGKIKFRPIEKESDPRLSEIFWRSQKDGDKQSKMAALFALVSSDSTGVPLTKKIASLKGITALSLEGPDTIKEQAAAIIKQLGNEGARLALNEYLHSFNDLSNELSSELGNKSGRTASGGDKGLAPNYNKKIACLDCIIKLASEIKPDANTQEKMTKALNVAIKELPADDARIMALSAILNKADAANALDPANQKF